MDKIKALLGYTVSCRHAGQTIVYHCWTRAEAVEIMKGYPIEWRVWINHSMGLYFVAARRIWE